jgi:hypothetical protein
MLFVATPALLRFLCKWTDLPVPFACFKWHATGPKWSTFTSKLLTPRLVSMCCHLLSPPSSTLNLSQSSMFQFTFLGPRVCYAVLRTVIIRIMPLTPHHHRHHQMRFHRRNRAVQACVASGLSTTVRSLHEQAARVVLFIASRRRSLTLPPSPLLPSSPFVAAFSSGLTPDAARIIAHVIASSPALITLHIDSAPSLLSSNLMMAAALQCCNLRRASHSA